jgi:hypothetical protein
MTTVLKDAAVPLDNNISEREVKPQCLREPRERIAKHDDHPSVG